MADGVPDGEFDERLRTFMFFKQAQAARRARRRLQQAVSLPEIRDKMAVARAH